MSWKALLLFISLTLPVAAFGQIQITQQNLLGQIGTTQTIIEDERFHIPIDVGEAGANKVWDFRSTPLVDTVFVVNEFLPPGGLPGIERFPDVNWVQKITFPDFPDNEAYNYLNVTSDYLITRGDSVAFTEPIDTSFVFFQNDTVAPMPLEFGNMWTSTEIDTDGFYPDFGNISLDTTINHIDGWGMVRIPLGDFECLRLRQDIKAVNLTVVAGEITSSNTDTWIQYDWISKNEFFVARAQSQFGNTNPDFTDANGYGLLHAKSGTPTSVEGNPEVPESFVLFQNYPNPFNPETAISFQMREAGPVDLTIFNVLGQPVRKLVSGFMDAGSRQVTWDGTDNLGQRVSSGVYVYQLQSSELVQTKKMVLLQ